MDEEKLEGLIRFYSFASLLMGLITLIYGLAMAAGWTGTDIFTAFLGILYIIFSFALFIAARGLWLRTIWARYLSVLLSAILIIFSIINLSPGKLPIMIIAGSVAFFLYRQY